MLKKTQTFVLFVATGLLLFLTGCEVPEDGFGLLGTGSAVAGAPRSNFVSERQVLRVRVGEPTPIESYHLSGPNKLGKLEIFVNGQLVKSEQTDGSLAFPDTLATVQVLERGRPDQPDFAILEFPAPACNRLLVKGGPAAAHLLEREFPASTWTVCHVWIGHIPGTYDLSLRVTDRTGQPGEMITQRIEVLEES